MTSNNTNDFTPWSEFDPIEYAHRNYSEMLPEDETIIRIFHETASKLGIKLEQFDSIADVGAGPNLYPAMLLSPYVKGKINLLEYSEANRDYVMKILDGEVSGEYPTHIDNWKKYNKKIKDIIGDTYDSTLEQLKSKLVVKEGNIYDLPENTFPAVSSFFCSESITSDIQEFQKAINSLIGSVKPGGLFVVAHMVGSEGYYAGDNTNFPAVKLTLTDLYKTYNSNDGVEKFHIEGTTTEAGDKKPREGYHSMVVVMGIKKS